MNNWKKRMQVLVLSAALCVLNVWSVQSYAATPYGPTSPGISATAPTMPGPSANNIVGPSVTGPYLGGARLTLLTNQSASQMLSVVIETKNGRLIVLDGGTDADANHLEATIKAKGGRVSAWLITHPHSDHVGALTALLNRGTDITIDNVYYNLTSIEWYQTHEAYRAEMVAQFAGALGKLPAEKLHGHVGRGDEIMVDDVIIRVLNSPYLIENNAINNSSVAYSMAINGKSVVFLGDMGVEAGNQLMSDYSGQTIACDILQMAHHGQHGVSENVYKTLKPKICLWPTPDWLWNNDNGSGYNTGQWETLATRSWMEKLGVSANYCIKDGDQVIE